MVVSCKVLTGKFAAVARLSRYAHPERDDDDDDGSVRWPRAPNGALGLWCSPVPRNVHAGGGAYARASSTAVLSKEKVCNIVFVF